MKKVKISRKPGAYYAHLINSGSFPNINFAWMSKANKDNEFQMLSSFAHCREVFINSLCNCICEEIPRNSYNSLLYDRNISLTDLLPDTRARIMVAHVSRISESPKGFPTRAKRVLNIFERYLGWRLTRISICEGKCCSTVYKDYEHTVKVNDYLFEFSKKWTRSPELLSLYLLIVKLCRYTLWENFHNVEDLPKMVSKVNSRSINDEEIRHCFKSTCKYWKPVLDRVDELFMHQSAYENFRHYDGINGFHTFVLNKDVRSSAAKKWKKIRKELGGKSA